MRSFFTIGFLLIALSSFAQIKKGREQLEAGNYQDAIKSLKKEFYGKEHSVEAGVLLAKCYYKLMEYPDALDVMNEITKNRITDNDDMRFYADVLLANEDYTGAYLLILESLSIDYSDEKSILYLEKVGDILEWDTSAVGSTVRQVQGINSSHNEYGPYLDSQEEIWFISDVNTVQSIFPAAYNNSNLFLFYKAALKSSVTGSVQKPGMLIKKRQYYYHDGPLDKWDGTNNYALTLRDIDAPIKGGRIGIYFSQMTGTDEDIMPFKYNEKYNTGHPTFANKGKRLIFASDRPGGYGLMDLWYCDWVEGAWTEPVNMGPVINTPFNELFPSYSAGRLYFSSDRLDIGYGALDVYYSSELFGYNRVVNLHAPINSAYDDFAMTFQNDTEGFFSSNRRSGSGGDDIYTFLYQPPQETIEKANLQILATNLPSGSLIEIYDLKGAKITTVTTSAEGKIELANLKTNQTYRLKLVGQDLEAEALLLAFDKKGSRYGPFPQISPGEFLFELLPVEDYILNEEENIDLSYLQFDLNGRVVEAEGTPIVGVPVSLLDDSGQVVQTVESKSGGHFIFTNVESGKMYSLQTKGLDRYHEIDVYGATGAIVQSLSPVGINTFSYLRQTTQTYLTDAPAIITPSVIAVVPTLDIAQNSKAKLFNESDTLLAEPLVDEEGFMTLKNLQAGKAYRLNMTETIKPLDRLLILAASGDTAQTVRPFDSHNYIFEYLVYTDYGQPETVEIEVAPAKVYRAKIKDYYPLERTAFLLENIEEGTKDTVYCATNGTIVLKSMNPKQSYSLTMIGDSLDSDKTLMIYDDENNLIFEGTSRNRSMFNFVLIPDVDYALSNEENNDISILTMGLTGRFMGDEVPAKAEIKATSAEGKMLASSYTVYASKINFSGLEVADKFVLEPITPGEYGDLKIVTTGKTDSLRIKRDDDGKYYVNLAKSNEPTLIVQDNNKPKVVPSGSTFDLKNIYYDFNSAKLRTESFPTLNKLADFMAENPEVLVEIRSYSDCRGPANYNLLLSQQRAESVKAYLIKKGVATRQLRALGKGETEPVNKCVDGIPCSNEEHAENRRTQFSVEPIK